MCTYTLRYMNEKCAVRIVRFEAQRPDLAVYAVRQAVKAANGGWAHVTLADPRQRNITPENGWL